jgi:shikimate kinase
LCASAAFLASRLAVSKRERPLLFDDQGQPLAMDALKKRVSGLLDERRAVYEQAHITVVVDAVSVSNIIKAIREEMAADR